METILKAGLSPGKTKAAGLEEEAKAESRLSPEGERTGAGVGGGRSQSGKTCTLGLVHHVGLIPELTHKLMRLDRGRGPKPREALLTGWRGRT